MIGVVLLTSSCNGRKQKEPSLFRCSNHVSGTGENIVAIRSWNRSSPLPRNAPHGDKQQKGCVKKDEGWSAHLVLEVAAS